MKAAAVVIALVISGVLMWAALEKLRSQRAFRETLSTLGLGGPLPAIVGVGVPGAEIAAACGVVLFPTAGWPRATVVALALVFASAGVLGLLAAQPVTCSCFGATGESVLGRRQIALLPGWLVAVWALSADPPHWPARSGLQYLAAVSVAIGVIRAAALARAWRASMGYRRAIEESVVVREPMVVPSHKEV